MSDNACCFCGDDVGRYGHNPAPVSDTGRCCDVCNQMVVIPARMSMMGFRSEGYEGEEIADKILTDTYGEWWVWSGNEPMDDPDNWNYIHDGAEGLYLGVHEYVSFLSGDDYDEVPITNLTEDNKEEIKDFLGFAAETEFGGKFIWDWEASVLNEDTGEFVVVPQELFSGSDLDMIHYGCLQEMELSAIIGGDGESTFDIETSHGYTQIDIAWNLDYDSLSIMGAETNLPGNITDIIMDEYLEQGESYEDAQEYARAATEKLKLDAEESVAEIEARMLEIEDMENPSEEDLDNLQNLESRYFELTGTFGAEDRPQFPAEAIEELKKHIVVFTGAGMMLSVFAAVGGFLLGRRTKEC